MVATVVEESFCTVIEPEDWLLLNVNNAPFGSVVPFGNLIV